MKNIDVFKCYLYFRNYSDEVMRSDGNTKRHFSIHFRTVNNTY